MKHFEKLSEIQVVSLLIKSIFEEFMVKKSTNVQQPAIRTEQNYLPIQMNQVMKVIQIVIVIHHLPKVY